MEEKTDYSNKVINLAKIGVFAALYVAITFLVAPFSYGAVQFRLSEGLNHLADFNKRYILSLGLGCFIVNMGSPLGIIDMTVGPITTMLFAWLSYRICQKVKSLKLKLVISTLIFSVLGMIPVALELHFIQNLPFWWTYLTTMLGELVSMSVGAIVVYFVSQKVNLSK